MTSILLALTPFHSYWLGIEVTFFHVFDGRLAQNASNNNRAPINIDKSTVAAARELTY
ncbi:MAG: hypothetical protein WA324_06485 [Bryobacteraceae bacterium]